MRETVESEILGDIPGVGMAREENMSMDNSQIEEKASISIDLSISKAGDISGSRTDLEDVGNMTFTTPLTSFEIPTQSSNESLPFACTLCPARFAKKLHLSGHVEKRHGVKYVFTQRGKKVKLVRMPEIVNIGDKLDPCVEMLMKKAADGGQLDPKNSILVHTVETTSNHTFSGVAEELNPEDLFRHTIDGDLHCALLVDNVKTGAMEAARTLGDEPFVMFESIRDRKQYLLRIIQLNEKQQILIPATLSDVRKSDDTARLAAKSNAEFVTPTNRSPSSDSSQDSSKRKESKRLKTECSNLSGNLENSTREVKVAIVAYADMSVNLEKLQFEICVNSPEKDKLKTGQLMPFEEFKETVLLCKPQRLRCLSEAYTSIAPEVPTTENVSSLDRPKRKYTRRSYGKENKDPDYTPSVNEDIKPLIETPSKNKTVKEIKKPRRKWSKLPMDDGDDNSDDEEKDSTYIPELDVKPPKRRGRPRKIQFN